MLFAFLLAVHNMPGMSGDLSMTLQMQTQDLFDAVSNGNRAIWRNYLDSKATITDENGDVYDKEGMVKSIRALPAGVSGTIKVIDFKLTEHGSTAVTTYVCDEHENYHGQQLHCQYRNTDTWIKTKNGWRLLAEQVIALRTDPPAIELPADVLAGYAGKYVEAPDVTYEIRVRDGKLEGQRNGRAAEPLKVEAKDVLFTPGSPRYRKIFRRDEKGNVTSFVERREAWDITWTKTSAP